MYSSLHNHSDASFCDGFSKPIEYLQKAKELGLHALALTEHGGFESAPYIDILSKDFPDIKIIFGCEMYECFDVNVKDPNSKYFHLLVLCKNEQGRQALNKLITESNFRGFYYKPRIDINMIKPYAKDLIICSACLASKLARETDYKKCVNYVKEYKAVFPNFFLEMQSHRSLDQAQYNQKILQLANDTSTDFIITTDSHAVSQSELYYQARFVQIARDADTMSESYEDCYMQSDEEIHNIMDSQIGYENVCIGLDNTNKIADMCDEVHLPFSEPKIPTFQVDPRFNSDYDQLVYLCEQGWRNRKINKMSEHDIQVRRERYEYELSVIHEMGFVSYFLIVWDFIKWARDNGVVVGDGRGSAGGSLICYLLGISALDPIKYDLIFERFLNKERISLPDVDVDFADRDKVIKYLTDKYGQDHVCQIMSFSEITPTVAIKDTARVLGIPYKVSDTIAKAFSYSTFEECVEHNSDLVAKYAEYTELFDIAKHLCGKYRQTGIHAGGFGIVDRDITYYMPLKQGKNGERVIQCNKKIAEKLSIVKFDLLGVATLQAIQEIKSDLQLNDWELDPNNPEFLSNKPMYEVLGSAKTNGVFQVESAGMKNLLQRLQPTSLEDVSAVLALYRPDSMFMLDDFIHYKHNPEEIQYIHPDMEKVTGKTYNAIIYQEEIMDITRVFGGRSMGGADRFRKGITSKDIDTVHKETELLRQEIVQNGYSKELADIICEQMHKYGNYCFCKAHSAEYGVICLRTAYLKANYPVYFFKALLNLNKDKAGALNKYILDARDFNVEILAPHINKSEMNFSVYDNKVLFGLSAITGVGENVADAIILERNTNGKFKNLDDLLSRVSLTKSQVVALIKSGAIPTNNKKKCMIKYLMSMYDGDKSEFKPVKTLPSYVELVGKYNVDIEQYRTGKGKYDYNKPELLKVYNEIKRKTFEDKQKEKRESYIASCSKYLADEQFWEFHALQIFINHNPFEQAYKYISKQFEDVEINDSCMLVGVISKVQKKKDKNKNQFAFINIYSSFGLIEGTVWSSTYREYESLIRKGTQIAIRGRKCGDENIIVEKIKSYDQWLIDRKLKGK